VGNKVETTKGWRADASLAVASALAGAIVAVNLDWTLRPLVVLTCMIVGPGWAIGGLVEINDRVLGRIVCCALGVSVDILVALAMVSLGAWYPEAVAVLMLEASAAVLFVRARRLRRLQMQAYLP
jgi:hypothetical protein